MQYRKRGLYIHSTRQTKTCRVYAITRAQIKGIGQWSTPNSEIEGRGGLLKSSKIYKEKLFYPQKLSKNTFFYKNHLFHVHFL